LVVDSLICRLSHEGIFVVGYADDLALTISGSSKLSKGICRKMNSKAMPILAKWCEETALNVNPGKSSVINFTNSRTKEIPIAIKLFGTTLNIWMFILMESFNGIFT
jgi:Reverse transcriptase (RNA-dependent DNA polymerase)